MIESLTCRKRDVCERVAQGRTNQEIARELCIALPTVNNHVAQILQKLGVRNRTEAAIWWQRRNAPPPPRERR
ncbi:MAG: response regulator transcription factor [Chloroflexi bacterium]|nr:response regulator transcription factor [Chloroflexota bacterium]